MLNAQLKAEAEKSKSLERSSQAQRLQFEIAPPKNHTTELQGAQVGGNAFKLAAEKEKAELEQQLQLMVE